MCIVDDMCVRVREVVVCRLVSVAVYVSLFVGVFLCVVCCLLLVVC